MAIVYSFASLCLGKKRVTLERFVSEMGYGLTLFPVILLTATVFFSGAMEILMAGSKPFIFLAGAYTFVIIIKRPFDKAEVETSAK
ncbi:hypothetical protein D3C73_1211570 [compost metagenome]